MFEKLLHRMRGKIRSQDYVMALHAEEEMDAEDLNVFDVESVILTGRIVERQRDRATGERKYVLRGVR